MLHTARVVSRLLRSLARKALPAYTGDSPPSKLLILLENVFIINCAKGPSWYTSFVAKGSCNIYASQTWSQ